MPIQKKRQLKVAVPGQAREANFVLYPSAHGLARRWVERAQAKGTITAADAPTCEAALIAAAVITTHNRGSRAITAADVSHGWSASLSIGGPCIPAFYCMERSIVSRIDKLQQDLPLIGDILIKIK
jgi:hypothetical protein